MSETATALASGVSVASPFRLRKLGMVPYREAWLLQQQFAKSGEDYILVLEHPPTITLGRHGDPTNVLLDPAMIGAELVETDRGGDVTLHAPGQVVGYAVITIDDDPRAVKCHVHQLEAAVIATVQSVIDSDSVGGIGRLDGHPGVWVGIQTSSPAKIAAVGVRVERIAGKRRTLHGVALNVTNDLALFDAIVPCGLPNRPVTSLRTLGVDHSLRAIEDRLAMEICSAIDDDRPIDTVSVRTVTSAPVDTVVEPMMNRRLRAAGVVPENGLPLKSRKPEWLRVPVQFNSGFSKTRSVVSDLGLVTVCEEAGCPNIFECWADGTATFMVNGERCTRACGFCLIDTRKPLPLDASEPERVAEAVERMGLSHAVITCVARDDLSDGGAGAIGETILAIRRLRPATTVEVLISDLKGRPDDLQLILDAAPDVVNHNIETVARLQRAVRPSANYSRSLGVLGRAAAAGFVAKSGIMVGLGESDDEIVQTLADLAAVGVQLVTIGQYLRPTANHIPVARYANLEDFERYGEAGRALGLRHVQASPLTRSSYHAREAAAAQPVPVSLGRQH